MAVRRSLAAPEAPEPPPPVAGDHFIRQREVCARLGVSRTWLFRHVRAGSFPSPRRLSENAVAYLASEVEAWMKSRPQTRPDTTSATVLG